MFLFELSDPRLPPSRKVLGPSELLRLERLLELLRPLSDDLMLDREEEPLEREDERSPPPLEARDEEPERSPPPLPRPPPPPPPPPPLPSRSAKTELADRATANIVATAVSRKNLLIRMISIASAHTQCSSVAQVYPANNTARARVNPAARQTHRYLYAIQRERRGSV